MGKTATILVLEEDVYNSMFKVLFADMLELPDTYCIVEKERPTGKLYSFLNSKKRNVKKKSRGIFRFRRKRRFKLVDKLYIYPIMN